VDSGRKQGLRREEPDSQGKICSRHQPTGETGKTFGVPQARVITFLYDDVIASQLSLPSQMSIAQPHQGMKENEPASQCRQPIPQVIVLSRVDKFVPQNVI
jgi:hypothetical protein